MSAVLKTKFVGKVNPFTGEPKRKTVAAVGIRITDDPLPTRKPYPSKYEALFANLRPGKSLRVPTPNVNSVAQGLRKWLKNKGDTVHAVRSTTEYEGDPGHGRVWLLGGKA